MTKPTMLLLALAAAGCADHEPCGSTNCLAACVSSGYTDAACVDGVCLCYGERDADEDGDEDGGGYDDGEPDATDAHEVFDDADDAARDAEDDAPPPADDAAADTFIPGCYSDLECDDGRFCNGVEFCFAGIICRRSIYPNCNDGDPCTEDDCDDALGGCFYTTRDRDHDGCIPVECGGTDCDDRRTGHCDGPVCP